MYILKEVSCDARKMLFMTDAQFVGNVDASFRFVMRGGDSRPFFLHFLEFAVECLEDLCAGRWYWDDIHFRNILFSRALTEFHACARALKGGFVDVPGAWHSLPFP